LNRDDDPVVASVGAFRLRCLIASFDREVENGARESSNLDIWVAELAESFVAAQVAESLGDFRYENDMR